MGPGARPARAARPRGGAPAGPGSPKPASGRLKGSPSRSTASSPLTSSTARPGPMSRPTPGALDQRQARRRRQGLAPGKAGQYPRGNCPGCGNAPIEACRRRMDCGSSWTLLRITVVAVIDVGRAQVAARCAGDHQRVALPTGVSPSLRDASPQFCLMFSVRVMNAPEIQGNQTRFSGGFRGKMAGSQNIQIERMRVRSAVGEADGRAPFVSKGA
jgi:hypothetical protein